MPLHLLMRLLLARSLMLAPDTGGGAGGGDDDDQDDDVDDDLDSDDEDEDDDDPGDDPVKLKAALAARDAEAKKWKRLSRKHEDRAKAGRQAAKERDELKRKGLPPSEQALATARDEGKAEAAREAAMRIARTEVRAELKGRLSDDRRDALLEAIDLSRFLDDDNEVDTDKVAEWADTVAPKSDKDDDASNGGGKKTKKDLGQGRRPQGGKPSVASGRELYEQLHPTKTTT